MGNSRWDVNDWDRHAATTRGKSTQQIFDASKMKTDLDPRKIKVRESRDSAANPNSTPIILALDVTGSMGEIAGSLAREGLGTLIQAILERKPVSDPHIMVMGVGDAQWDNAPLQVSQFEADIKIAKQLKNLFLEGGGGPLGTESYTLPWYFAAKKTDIDCTKHGRKGILFTFGDEECPLILTREQIEKATGDKVPADLTAKELLDMVSQKYEVFHVVIEQGDYASSRPEKVLSSWSKVLPADRIIPVKDYTKVPEVLVSVMDVYAGKKPADVIASWQGKTAETVRDAIKNVKPGSDAVISVLAPLKLKFPATTPAADTGPVGADKPGKSSLKLKPPSA
jgi:hypothetical protein